MWDPEIIKQFGAKYAETTRRSFRIELSHRIINYLYDECNVKHRAEYCFLVDLLVRDRAHEFLDSDGKVFWKLEFLLDELQPINLDGRYVVPIKTMRSRVLQLGTPLFVDDAKCTCHLETEIPISFGSESLSSTPTQLVFLNDSDDIVEALQDFSGVLFCVNSDMQIEAIQALVRDYVLYATFYYRRILGAEPFYVPKVFIANRETLAWHLDMTLAARYAMISPQWEVHNHCEDWWFEQGAFIGGGNNYNKLFSCQDMLMHAHQLAEYQIGCHNNPECESILLRVKQPPCGLSYISCF